MTMKKSIQKLTALFPQMRSADHTHHDWDADDYRLDESDTDTGAQSGMSRYPALLLDSTRNVALAEWNWMALPALGANAGACAYMLSTRRI